MVLALAAVIGAGLGELVAKRVEHDRAKKEAAVVPMPPSQGVRKPAVPTAVAAAPAAPASLLTHAELSRLVERVARATNGRVQAAVLGKGNARPVAAASSGSLRSPFRMWSVSKAATAIALLQAHAKAPLPADTRFALDKALVGSGDCAQRQMTVELQELAGGPAAARRRIQSVLDRAGATSANVLPREAVAGTGCRPYLEQHSRIPDPYRSALQVGTAEWTVRDAARFALALGDGTYGRRITRRMLHVLRIPKRRSDDPFAHGLDVTTTPAWGAGVALGDLHPAYKAGWGGSSGETPTFVNEQVIHLALPDGRRYGIAITFEGPDIPERDDPALTAAPRAFRLLLTRLRRSLNV